MEILAVHRSERVPNVSPKSKCPGAMLF